ncbi:hypothetical protein SAMN06295912_15015 [Sphingomonas laterariae]|uniref:Uncharacterized protein n=1 Tax=Edaphosphingomonas laterariae TaxID=861865 RepID=A0A239KBV9_9SPHN|nr:hypothetical protein [Sphingomonas laterariae]SNT15897.1 hypothetical protein SAMN06295912_15015 [Sphingomonas laterariae]
MRRRAAIIATVVGPFAAMALLWAIWRPLPVIIGVAGLAWLVHEIQTAPTVHEIQTAPTVHEVFPPSTRDAAIPRRRAETGAMDRMSRGLADRQPIQSNATDHED